MLLSLNWLQDFVPFSGEVEDLAHRLTMVGLEVEEIATPFDYLEKVVVGKVVECKSHPNSDHLSLCKVDVGKEILPIVCGAPNVRANQLVPVALVGATLPSGLTIKKAKLRGEVSVGMICSAKELELGEDASGIWVLDKEFPKLTLGDNLREALNLDKYVLDIGITPNRADCLSVLGIAREVAVLYSLPLKLPCVDVKEISEEIDYLIEIPAKNDCYLYQARLVKDCQLKESPFWVRGRLLASGVRPINNIVDVTNYVMLELGQPLHAFDRKLLAGNKIRVDLAKEGQKFTTLDGKERNLLSSDLLIWDSEKPVALAGVMGGENSEINENSTEVLLECAVFNPITIRKTARRLGLSSESSYRFERGIDQLLSPFALERATHLLQQLTSGKVLRGIARKETKPYQERLITFRPEKVSELLGVEISSEFCEQTLESLGCEIKGDLEKWLVTPPSYRHDLEREVDLIEEVGRIYGLDKIAATLPKVSKSLDTKDELSWYKFLSEVKKWARGIGLNEVINYSFVAEDTLNLLKDREQEKRVYILNPLSEEQNVLRTELLAGMLNSVKANFSRENKELRLFEVAKTFFVDTEVETLCREVNRLGILLSGFRQVAAWPHQEDRVDYFDLKGIVEHFASVFQCQDLKFVLEQRDSYLKPWVKVLASGKEIGFLGLVKEDIADKFEAKQELWYADLNLDEVFNFYQRKTYVFQELPKFPGTTRDITLVCPLNLTLAEILEVIYAVKVDILEEVKLVDIYYPKAKEEKNITLRLFYRAKNKNLKDKEVNKVHSKIGNVLLEKLDVRFP